MDDDDHIVGVVVLVPNVVPTFDQVFVSEVFHGSFPTSLFRHFHCVWAEDSTINLPISAEQPWIGLSNSGMALVQRALSAAYDYGSKGAGIMKPGIRLLKYGGGARKKLRAPPEQPYAIPPVASTIPINNHGQWLL